jgi:hypothetical protein
MFFEGNNKSSFFTSDADLKIWLISLFVITLLFVLPALKATGQAMPKGKVEVIKDPRVDSLAAHRFDLNRTTGAGTGLSSTATTAFGYRVQIYSGSNRKEAFDTQSLFQAEYPDVRTYVIYREPNFKVRAGDFRTRLEATKLMEELRHTFTGMFIISETINLPKPDIANEQRSN